MLHYKLGCLHNNNNNNLCISGVFDHDFNLITSKDFVTGVRQLNTIHVYVCCYLIFFLYNMVFDNLRLRKSGLSS